MAPSGDKPAIEDDWQQVDDAGSVHSLPLTDDAASDSDLVDLGEQSASVETLKKKVSGLPGPTSQPPGSNIIGALDVDGRPYPAFTSSQSAPRRMTLRPAEAHDGADPSNKPAEEDGEEEEEEDDDDEEPDHVLNFAPKLANLRCRLNDVTRDTEANMTNRIDFQTPLIRNIYQSLCAIREQMNVLGPVVHDCACFYRMHHGDMDSDDLPLHGDLPSWTGQLHDFLLTFQSQADAVVSGRSQIFEMLSALEQPDEQLTMLRQTMDDFLPLIEADFDAFKTKYMGFDKPEPRTNRVVSRDDSQTVAALRTAFYRLHDEVRQTLDLIVEIHTSKGNSAIATSAPLVISSLSNVRDAIMNIVTNNPSEWMESDLNTSRRILSYPAFISLSPEMLSDVTDQLKQVRQQLDVTNDPDMGQSFSRDVLHAHQVVLLTEGGQLEELQSTANFLESLLVPGGGSC
ncbi:uncharacterized protein F5Z01DRAFT_94584 [Emericellopsis atlantica]|uniref:Uncharacterized protein n=1 Tax=Emericellopsis atlantica TaxID=2614577 RepID=A0A9P7ZMF0_9HYPO|nr:uncharacterized protein F5Z01DRAFT_94584 [Emericellopsis atlantica]KAG9254794.1 hypothetical protein F5Z01DRAFT_94584 [Emericellopsis atlantica]